MKIDILEFDIECVVDSLRVLYEDNHLSIDKALAIIKRQFPNSSISRSTVASVFRKDGDKSFKWEATLKPIVTAMLNSPEIETGAFDVYNSVLQLKRDKIKKIETEKADEKRKYHERLEKETREFQKTIDFLNNQIKLKDDRITQLMADNTKLVNHFLDCPYRKECQ